MLLLCRVARNAVSYDTGSDPLHGLNRPVAMKPAVASLRVAEILGANLKSAFADLCVERYGGPLSLVAETVDHEAPSVLRFRLEQSGRTQLIVRLRVKHVGGNIFDVVGEIEDGPSQSFTYSLPDPTPLLTPDASDLTKRISIFVLDTMERRIGSRLLERSLGPGPSQERETTGPPSSAPEPDIAAQEREPGRHAHGRRGTTRPPRTPRSSPDTGDSA